MKLNAAMQKKQEKIMEWEYRVSDILELSESEYAALYQDLLEEREYFIQRADIDSTILVLGENQKDGILVDTCRTAFAYSSAFIPEARVIVQNHIRQLADYCISEGTAHSEDGRWQISYDELYDHFDAEISDTNGNGKLLRGELKQREEINELIMTEDCIEMTYHLEYCQNCQQGGIEGTAALLSLMGCNLYEEHITDESEEHSTKAASIIRQEQSEDSAPALSM